MAQTATRIFAISATMALSAVFGLVGAPAATAASEHADNHLVVTNLSADDCFDTDGCGPVLLVRAATTPDLWSGDALWTVSATLKDSRVT